MIQLVKMHKKWCLVGCFNGELRSVCTEEIFCTDEYLVKKRTKQGSIKDINCPKCNEIINWYKTLK